MTNNALQKIQKKKAILFNVIQPLRKVVNFDTASILIHFCRGIWQFPNRFRCLEDYHVTPAGVWPRDNSDGTYRWVVVGQEKWAEGIDGERWGKRKRVIQSRWRRFEISDRVQASTRETEIETPKKRWRVGCRKEPVAGRDVLVGEHSVHHRYHTDWLLRLLTFYR